MGIAAAAAIGAVGAIGGGVIAASGAKSAANASAQSARDAAAVQQQTYAENKQLMQPFVNTGTAAMGNINALLGIGGPTPTAAPAATGTGATAPTVASAGLGGWQTALSNYRERTGLAPTGQNATATPATGTATTTQPTAQQAFDTYKNSTGYQFRVNEGMDALNSGWAGKGMLQSGAAAKSALDYGQGMASQEFGNYMNALGNQQALGFSGASAVAGVGQNYANQLGTIYQQNGANQANAALASSNALGAGISGAGGAIGTMIGYKNGIFK